MSQITRCPSCATMFKVVADQLRISDGWVRCGHCKQVFDASAHLQPVQPQALMPDLALDQVRPPPQPVTRSDPPARSWGTLPAQPASMESGLVDGPAAVGAEEVRHADAALTLPNVLSVPEPAVPAFLAVQARTSEPAEEVALPPLALVPETPFPWRTPEPAPSDVPAPRAGALAPSHVPAAGIEWPTIEFTAPPLGYELPSPVLADDDSHDLLASADSEAGAPQSPEPEPPVSDDAMVAEETPAWTDDAPVAEQSAPPLITEPEQPEAAEPDEAQEVDAQASAPATVAVDTPERQEATPDAEPLADEPSFVRAARRKAFWRTPAVRLGLFLLALVLMAGLLLQVAVHERHYIAAMVPQVRAPLEVLCGPLQCKVGPYRHIASVVVDGSSFQKLKGDEYQFSLTLRNRSDHAVEMPAVELTLTDAQEQPVLRRVLRTEELAAPAELLAQAEWSTTVPVQMAPGSARITGYRVLAFYP